MKAKKTADQCSAGQNSDIFFAIPDPLHDGEMLAVLLIADAVTYKGKKYES